MKYPVLIMMGLTIIVPTLVLPPLLKPYDYREMEDWPDVVKADTYPTPYPHKYIYSQLYKYAGYGDRIPFLTPEVEDLQITYMIGGRDADTFEIYQIKNNAVSKIKSYFDGKTPRSPKYSLYETELNEDKVTILNQLLKYNDIFKLNDQYIDTQFSRNRRSVLKLTMNGKTKKIVFNNCYPREVLIMTAYLEVCGNRPCGLIPNPSNQNQIKQITYQQLQPILSELE